MAQRKKRSGNGDDGAIEFAELTGAAPDEAFPKDYFETPPPADIFGPRSLIEPLKHYSPGYMSAMFGAGLTEDLHRRNPPRTGPGLNPAPAAPQGAEPRPPRGRESAPGGGADSSKDNIIWDPHDDRVQVPNTTVPPYRAVCRLETLKHNGTVEYGTGWFASANIVVTAGHCLYRDGVEPAEVYVTPGLNGASAPYRSQVSRRIWAPAEWREGGDDRYDFGIILLPDKQMGNKTGWFGYASAEDSHLPNMRIHSAGYPEDFQNIFQVSCPGRVRGFDGVYIWHDIDTVPGQSGSPVIHTHAAGNWTVIGIHTDSEPQEVNRAMRINAYIFGKIRKAVVDNS